MGQYILLMPTFEVYLVLFNSFHQREPVTENSIQPEPMGHKRDIAFIDVIKIGSGILFKNN